MLKIPKLWFVVIALVFWGLGFGTARQWARWSEPVPAGEPKGSIETMAARHEITFWPAGSVDVGVKCDGERAAVAAFSPGILAQMMSDRSLRIGHLGSDGFQIRQGEFLTTSAPTSALAVKRITVECPSSP